MSRLVGRLLDVFSSMFLYPPARRAAVASFLAGCFFAWVLFGHLFNNGLAYSGLFAIYVLIVGGGIVCAFVGTRAEREVMGEVVVLAYAAPFASLIVGPFAGADKFSTDLVWGLGVPLVLAVVSTTLGCILATWSVARFAEKAQTRCCQSCGYDLRAHAAGERCPECGTVSGRSIG